MSDQRLRDLERRALAGEPVAVEIDAERRRLGLLAPAWAPDPKRDPIRRVLARGRRYRTIRVTGRPVGLNAVEYFTINIQSPAWPSPPRTPVERRRTAGLCAPIFGPWEKDPQGARRLYSRIAYLRPDRGAVCDVALHLRAARLDQQAIDRPSLQT